MLTIIIQKSKRNLKIYIYCVYNSKQTHSLVNKYGNKSNKTTAGITRNTRQDQLCVSIRLGIVRKIYVYKYKVVSVSTSSIALE